MVHWMTSHPTDFLSVSFVLFSRFKIPPSTFEYLLMRGSPEVERDEPFRPAEQRVREDDWRRSKDDFFSEKARRDKLSC